VVVNCEDLTTTMSALATNFLVVKIVEPWKQNYLYFYDEHYIKLCVLTTRNVLTSDPLISSLDRHNGWSMTILWQKNDRQKRGIVDDRTWRIHWDCHNRLWWYWTVITLMTIQYRHGQFEEATSVIWRGIRVARGHISNPTWNTGGIHMADM
jgi:hypothetical protein